MNPDEQMVARGFPPGSHNLAIGEPAFLQEAFAFEDCMYPPSAGTPELLETLSKICPGKHVVVTNGAKQAISASIYAMNKYCACYGVDHAPPYWPSFPTLAENFDVPFKAGDSFLGRSVSIITHPNNPTGIVDGISIDSRTYDIWDSVYADFVYGYDGIEPSHLIRVDGVSKKYGLSGLRVGWLSTSIPDIAKFAAHFIEITTSGVSVVSQIIASKVILDDLAGKFDEGRKKARSTLISNGIHFAMALSEYVDNVQGVPANATGMFAFFHIKTEFQKVFDAVLKAKKIFLVNGKSCGMIDEGWYRMNLGQTSEYVRDTLYVLKEELICQTRTQN